MKERLEELDNYMNQQKDRYIKLQLDITFPLFLITNCMFDDKSRHQPFPS